jgi:hypothetical protein
MLVANDIEVVTEMTRALPWDKQVPLEGAMKKKPLIIAAAAVAATGLLAALVHIGPRNVLGMIRYDQREKGLLKVGDAAPSVELFSLDGSGRESLGAHFGGQPVVLIFGSFT